MKGIVKQQEHYGKQVWTNILMDELRHSDCLCLNCNQIDRCIIAQKLYEMCKISDIANGYDALSYVAR
jgi:hypothetical protein